MVNPVYSKRIFEKRDSDNKTFYPFSINSRLYESELDKKYGITLGNLKNGKESGFQGDLENNVSFNGGKGGYNHSTRKIKDKILKKYESLPDFCSMIVNTRKELLEYIKKIHELSYNHYVWAKEINLQGDFPYYCCGSSSGNVFLTLMDKGFPNSALVHNSKQDHSYVVLPFVFDKKKENGFVVVDPTSDQLFNDKKNAPRNNLFVVSGDKWKYETDWKHGQNLYPSLDDKSIFANLHTLKYHLDSEICLSYLQSIDKYFSEVFKNQVKVDIESF